MERGASAHTLSGVRRPAAEKGLQRRPGPVLGYWMRWREEGGLERRIYIYMLKLLLFPIVVRKVKNNTKF